MINEKGKKECKKDEDNFSFNYKTKWKDNIPLVSVVWYSSLFIFF